MVPEGVYLHGHRNWKPWRHSGTGGNVSAYGVFAIVGNEVRSGSQVLIGQLPGEDSKSYAVNGPKTLSASAPLGGIYNSGLEVLVLYDTGTPTPGDKYGPVSGQYAVSKSGTPLMFECMGNWDSTNKIMRARISPSMDEKVKVTSEDTEAGYLADKLVGDGDE